MSTLKVMGLESEFNEAVEWVKKFNFAETGRVSFFETTIRDLGALSLSLSLSLSSPLPCLLVYSLTLLLSPLLTVARLSQVACCPHTI